MNEMKSAADQRHGALTPAVSFDHVAAARGSSRALDVHMIQSERVPEVEMPHGWNTTTLDIEESVLRTLTDLQGRRWLSRGHSQCYCRSTPSIDRNSLSDLPRPDKLRCERESIDRFRSSAR